MFSILTTFLIYFAILIILTSILLFAIYIDKKVEANCVGVMTMILITAILAGFITNLIVQRFNTMLSLLFAIIFLFAYLTILGFILIALLMFIDYMAIKIIEYFSGG